MLFKQKIKYLLIAVSLPLAFSELCAQGDADLLRYSMLSPIGTARYNAMGGAFGSLGANFSSLSVNPAGIGFYTRHEISLTAGILSQKGVSDYYGESNRISKSRALVPQGGGVFNVYNGSREKGGLRSLQFAIGANRLKDFNTNVYTDAVNPQSSYMQDVAARSTGLDFAVQDNLADVGNLAYQTGLLNYSDTINMLYETFLGPGLQQKRVLQERGNITEMVMSFGGNWSDKLYFGLTLGIPIVDYSSVSVIEESNTGQSLPHRFKSYELMQRQDVNGTGLNLKLGLIYKPVHFFRVGVAFHTPTYYWLRENSSAELNTEMQYVLSDNSVLPNHVRYRFGDRYDVITPLKGVLSLGFLIQNFGAISVEGELTDYRTMRIDVGGDISYENYIQEIVRENYRVSGVVRVGTEWKVNILSFRAGYIWQSCPYTNEQLRNNWSNHTATAGLGLTLGAWNLDFGFMADLGKRTDDFYYLIDGTTNQPLVQPAKLDFAKYVYTLTLGFRF